MLEPRRVAWTNAPSVPAKLESSQVACGKSGAALSKCNKLNFCFSWSPLVVLGSTFLFVGLQKRVPHWDFFFFFPGSCERVAFR